MRLSIGVMLTLVCAACHGGTASTLPRETTALVDALPPSAQLFGYANLAVLRRSPHADALAPIFTKLAELEREVAPFIGTDGEVAEVAMAVTDFRALDHREGGMVIVVRVTGEGSLPTITGAAIEREGVSIERCGGGVFVLTFDAGAARCGYEGTRGWANAALRDAIANDAVVAGTLDAREAIGAIESPMARAAIEDLEGGSFSASPDGDGMIVRYAVHVHDPRAAATLDYLQDVLVRVLSVSGAVPAELGFLLELRGRYEDDFVEWSVRLDGERVRGVFESLARETPATPSAGASDFAAVPQLADGERAPLVIYFDDQPPSQGISMAQAQSLADLAHVSVLVIGPPADGWETGFDGVLEHVRARREQGIARFSLAVDEERVVLAGLGVGGFLSCELAARQPGFVRGAVCMAPSFLDDRGPPELDRFGASRFAVIAYEDDGSNAQGWEQAMRRAGVTPTHETIEGMARGPTEEDAFSEILARAVGAVLAP